MTSNFKLVEEFMDTFNQNVERFPILGTKGLQDLRVELIREELEELKDALKEKDEVEVADALTDLLYVVYGAGHAFGIPLDKCFEEVHASNMSKLDKEGKPIYREDGKILKGPGYFKPMLEEILFW